MLSGAVGFSTTSRGNEKVNGFNFSPKAGYFVTNNIAVGVALGFGSNKHDMGFGVEEKITTFSVGAFGRYYFKPGSQFSIFGQLGVNSNSSKDENTVGNITTVSKINGFDVMLSPGISYFVSRSLAIEASFGALGYETEKPNTPGADSTDSFGLNLNLSSINFGLVYKI
jgi:outer membrane protein